MQNWKFAINSIMGHKMRSFLTMLGIIIGVMSVVVIVALGSGMSNAFTDVWVVHSKMFPYFTHTREVKTVTVL